mgnify:CR=1 FL=1
MCIRDSANAVRSQLEKCDKIVWLVLIGEQKNRYHILVLICLLYTSDAADERSSVDLGGRRIIKKKNKIETNERDKIKSIRDITKIYWEWCIKNIEQKKI